MWPIRVVPHFFEVLMDRMNPEKNLRAIGWPEVGAEINFPPWVSQESRTDCKSTKDRLDKLKVVFSVQKYDFAILFEGTVLHQKTCKSLSVKNSGKIRYGTVTFYCRWCDPDPGYPAPSCRCPFKFEISKNAGAVCVISTFFWLIDDLRFRSEIKVHDHPGKIVSIFASQTSGYRVTASCLFLFIFWQLEPSQDCHPGAG